MVGQVVGVESFPCLQLIYPESPLNDGPIVYLGIARHHRLTRPS